MRQEEIFQSFLEHDKAKSRLDPNKETSFRSNYSDDKLIDSLRLMIKSVIQDKKSPDEVASLISRRLNEES